MITLTNRTAPSPDDILPLGTDTVAGDSRGSAIPPSKGAGKKRSVVVVLGMHRSGTSLLASLLTSLGVNLGEKLLAADCNNEAGYWEQEEIYRTQDMLLQQLGRHWIGPAGTVPLPSEWWKLPEVQPVKKHLAAIVRDEIAKSGGMWGFKDPRTSRLLPMWKEIFAELGIEPIYLLAIRDPAKVVESVIKRDEIAASRAELLWLLHNLDAVRDAGEQLRLVVDYDRWFTQPGEQTRAVLRALDIQWPENEEPLMAGVKERIRPGLRHCQTRRSFALPLVSETFAALKTAASTGKIPGELKRLDSEVRRAIALCEPWASAVEEFTRLPVEKPYSFIEHFSEARYEPLGPEAQSSIWDALVDGPMERALFLHPPARLHFHVPKGRRARLMFAVCIHPHAWSKPNAGGCEFICSANETVRCSLKIDPVRVASDRRWHECALDIPENPDGGHDIVFETRQWGGSLDFRWAVWRHPRLTWLPDVPPLPPSALGQDEPAKPAGESPA